MNGEESLSRMERTMAALAGTPNELAVDRLDGYRGSG
jgi:hypothetical protein